MVAFFLKLSVLVISSSLLVADPLDFNYHSNEDLENILEKFSFGGSGFRLRKNLYSIGNTSGRPKSGIPPSPIWVLELTAAPEDRVGVPNVKLVGNIHGTEPAGREVLLHFIEYLIEEYEDNEMVTWLLNNTKIHILPSLNPDGFAVANKFFCYGCSSCPGVGVSDDEIIISSNFPDYFHTNEVLEHATETLAVMKWMEDVKFILSGSFFGSFVVAIYPYCNKNETRFVNPTPDDDVFQFLAKTYSNNHPIMHKGLTCPSSSLHFDGGIINGAAWHNHDADMTDYNYIFRGCMEVRFEISCCKYPDIGELEGIWLDNKNALLQYCMQANRGVTGQVLDLYTRKPIEATMKIVGRDMEFRNYKKTGEFWRILLPGDYQIQVEADGYYPQIQNFSVIDYKTDLPKLTHLPILMLNTSISTTTVSTTQPTTTSTEAIKMITQTNNISQTPQQLMISTNCSQKCLGNYVQENIYLIVCALFCVYANAFSSVCFRQDKR
ncbi:carboxypeptidase M-like [Diabrotica undecimpunctata]|uniref:carboxypeptidase M-like n=1 Tax=Diabrotica undecimpunctata TaxID=50387 RepID=UPI003B63A7EA